MSRFDDKGFRALRESGAPVGASRSIGGAIAAARDDVARVLIRCGATPNHVTIVGFLFTCAAAGCLAGGAGHGASYLPRGAPTVSWWPVLALAGLFLAGACDMLDGAVARVGGLGSKAGAVLDSSVDRLSDVVIYIGCVLHFGLGTTPNLTYQLLAVMALVNGMLISYVKARAENVLPDCGVGYWQRGERVAAVVIGCATGHVPAVLWQQALSTAFTVWRRMSYAYRVLAVEQTGQPPPQRGPVPGRLGKLHLWRYPRGSVQYDLVTAFHILFIIVGPWYCPVLRGGGPGTDPLRAILTGLAG